MKNIATLFFFLILLFSCGKKELKKETKEAVEPVFKETVIQVDDTSKEEVSKLVFTVQIAALRKKNKKLDGIDNVTIYQENSFLKYSLGTFKTYEEARAYRLNIVNEYKGAFVQALKNDVPIAITEALQ